MYKLEPIAPECTLNDLICFTRVAEKAGKASGNYELWVSLPHGSKYKFPLYTIATPTEKLRELILGNMLYNELPLDKNYYLKVIFIGKHDARIFVQYQHIIGSRLLCTVKQSDVVKFFNGVKK